MGETSVAYHRDLKGRIRAVTLCSGGERVAHLDFAPLPDTPENRKAFEWLADQYAELSGHPREKTAPNI